jgi:arylsulfatase A-like enzyme
MPLVVAGPGIRSGQRFDYAEQIDIVPTLCYLMGVKPPANADGRILAEAMLAPPAHVPARQQRMKELDTMIRDGDLLLAKLHEKAKKSPALREKLAALESDYYGLDRILHWNRFGTLDHLMAHDRDALKKLSDLAGQAP